MAEFFYTSEKNVLYFISFLKQYRIRKIVASPGTTNITFVSSVERDDFFEIYSCVDERSAAYMAVGLAEQSKEPVVLSCTGATASRNYMSALTEAYYRKLPIIACTSTQNLHNIGHLVPQVIDRGSFPKDISVCSINLLTIKNEDDAWHSQILLNKAFASLFYKGGGPVHINMETTYSRDYSVKSLPQIKLIKTIQSKDDFPLLPNGNICIFIGSHLPMNQDETNVIESFALRYNVVVFKDHTSNYNGKNALNFVIKGAQDVKHNNIHFDLVIHIGEVSGDYCTMSLMRNTSQVWRVSKDGEIRDTFKKLNYVFEMEEKEFFLKYLSLSPSTEEKNDFYQACYTEKQRLFNQIPDLPFSNIYIAKFLSDKLPKNIVLHLGILNSLRSWNFFDIASDIEVYSNVGGFGIDGCLSSLIGSALASKDKLCFAVLGDLATFYDLNVLANRHLPKNIRILVINNGLGEEFKNYNHAGAMFGEESNNFIAAKGHNGNKSPNLIKHFAEDLAFKYICANNEEEFLQRYKVFVDDRVEESPILFEVFTKEEDETKALYLMRNIEQASNTEKLIKKAKNFLNNHLIKE